MDELDDLGRYIQSRLRAKGITDLQVAKALNISPKTVQKIYPLKDIYSERLSVFCELLEENVFLDYYGRSEPLKSILNKELKEAQKLLKTKDELLDIQRKYINKLEAEVQDNALAHRSKKKK